MLRSRGPAGVRFTTLDSLRGVGALSVMLGHFYSVRPNFFYFPRFSFLSVDMFFALSGFVIARAYDPRFAAGLTAAAFLRARIRRLYPIYLCGLLLGLGATLAVNPDRLAPWRIVVCTAFGLVALPVPPMEPRDLLSPMNPAFWSLFAEFWLANLVYGALARPGRAPRWLIPAIVPVCAAGVIAVGVTGGDLNQGWGWPSVGGGVARTGYSFFAGVLLARSAVPERLAARTPPLVCLAAFVAAIAMPVPRAAALWWQILMVLLVFPSIVAAGAQRPAGGRLVGRVLGDMSYPAYAIHMPILVVIAAAMARSGWYPGAAIARIGFQAAILAAVAAIAWSLERGLHGRPAARTRRPGASASPTVANEPPR